MSLTKVEIAKAVGAILGVKIPVSSKTPSGGGGTVTKEAWENVLSALVERFDGAE
jgi:hypothetical protein